MIAKARREAKLTRKQLAEKIGIKANKEHKIWQYETGISVPQPVTLERIAEATGKPLSYFDPMEDW